MKKIIALLGLVIFIPGAHAYLGIDSYGMDHLLLRSGIPNESVVTELEGRHKQNEPKRRKDAQGFLRTARTQTDALLKKIGEAQVQMDTPEGRVFLGELKRVLDAGKEANEELVKRTEITPKLYGLLRDRIRTARSLPANAQEAFWRGERELRNAIMAEMSGLEKDYSRINRNWAAPGLQVGTGIDDLSLFQENATRLPAIFGTPRAMTMGGNGVVVPLQVRFDGSCSEVEREARGLLALRIDGNHLRMGGELFSNPKRIDAIVRQRTLTVYCQKVRESGINSTLNSKSGIVEIRYYYYSGDCYDGCNRFRLAKDISVL